MRSHSYAFSKKNQSKKLRSIMMVRCWDWKKFESKMLKLEIIQKWPKTKNNSQNDFKQRLSMMMALRDTLQSLTRKFTQMRKYQNNHQTRIHTKEIYLTEINLKTNAMTNFQERSMTMDTKMRKKIFQIDGKTNTTNHKSHKLNSRNIRSKSKINFRGARIQNRMDKKINSQKPILKNKITSNTENEKIMTFW